MENERTSIRCFNVTRAKDNATARGMTDAQHRAVSMLALYTSKLLDYCGPLEMTRHRVKRYADFFLHVVPVMLHTAGLPELNFEGAFIGTIDTDLIIEKSNRYLRYIDKKYGTWYEITDPYYAA